MKLPLQIAAGIVIAAIALYLLAVGIAPTASFAYWLVVYEGHNVLLALAALVTLWAVATRMGKRLL